MTNRELETRYTQMQLTWKNLVNANIDLVDENKMLKEENERLNNIINELEKYINEEYIYDELGMKIFDASELQDKLQELKGSDK